MPMQHDPEEAEIKYLRKVAPIDKAHVLEVGCGEGRLMWRYAASAKQVTGFDLNPKRLESARLECPSDLRPRVNLAQTTAESLPFLSETFDLVILAWSL